MRNIIYVPVSTIENGKQTVRMVAQPDPLDIYKTEKRNEARAEKLKKTEKSK